MRERQWQDVTSSVGTQSCRSRRERCASRNDIVEEDVTRSRFRTLPDSKRVAHILSAEIAAKRGLRGRIAHSHEQVRTKDGLSWHARDCLSGDDFCLVVTP